MNESENMTINKEEALNHRASSNSTEKGKGPKSILDIIFNFSYYINKLIGWFLALVLSIMTALVFWQVISRFVTGTSLSFSEEAARFLMIWLVMIGSAYALKNERLISVDILPERLGDKSGRILRIITHLISVILYLIFTIYGWQLSQTVSIQTAPGTGLSMFWPMFAMSLGGLLLTFNALINILKLASGRELK